MKEEALSALRVITPEEDVVLSKAKLMKYQTQYNLAYMLENLPAIVKSKELQQEQQIHKVEQMKKAQEG